jgi:RNA polymerase sigma-70 factor (ECF subfamily)
LKKYRQPSAGTLFRPLNLWLKLLINMENEQVVYRKNELEFEQLFKMHFRELHAYAFSIVKDWDVAEEVVQGMFLALWEKKDWTHVESSMRAYLYRSVYYLSLNVVRRQKIQIKYQDSIIHTMKNYIDDTSSKLDLSELDRQLQMALLKLPEKCRAIFHLSRFNDLKYQEIADHLDISIKTVETHMGKALRILRVEMKEYLPMLLLLLFNYLKR